jgi:hypothetical protein
MKKQGLLDPGPHGYCLLSMKSFSYIRGSQGCCWRRLACRMRSRARFRLRCAIGSRAWRRCTLERGFKHSHSHSHSNQPEDTIKMTKSKLKAKASHVLTAISVPPKNRYSPVVLAPISMQLAPSQAGAHGLGCDAQDICGSGGRDVDSSRSAVL